MVSKKKEIVKKQSIKKQYQSSRAKLDSYLEKGYKVVKELDNGLVLIEKIIEKVEGSK